MFRFAKPEYLIFLYLLPIILGLFIYTIVLYNKRIKNLYNQKLSHILAPYKSVLRKYIKFGLIFISIILLIISLANPQVGSKIEEVKQVGIDVYILLDVSLSMNAEDIKPSRLEKAKFEISRLIRKLRGDRIGLIVFSGKAYIQFPLTTDYSAANLFLSAVDFNTVPQPGTAIGEAIDLAVTSFKEDEETKKAIVVITDGEDHEGDLTEAAKNAAEKGIAIYAIGFGSPTGVPIPLYNKGGIQTGYKKDRKGNVVLTKLNESILRDVTNSGNGKYFRATNTSNELEDIYNELSKIEKSEFGTTKITEYEDRFYWFLIPAILILLIELLISEKKSDIALRFEKKYRNTENV